MPEKPATIAAYAAGASLAAITLFYVFGPNFTIDGDDSNLNNRKRSVVGLSNPANDCFINSVLQALAGLGELRVYLIRELHRREIENPDIYKGLPDDDEEEDVDEQNGSIGFVKQEDGDSSKLTGRRRRGSKGIMTPEERLKLLNLQTAPVTRALKEMLDGLNERPIYRKTISARGFIMALENAFRTRISRSQQDAHEFLQVVAERLCDEFHASENARKRARTDLLLTVPASSSPSLNNEQVGDSEASTEDAASMGTGASSGSGSRSGRVNAVRGAGTGVTKEEYTFPLEGKLESQVECQFCHYKYKPNQTSFVNLTLQVPQKSSTTLSACFDGLLKTEYIEDFRCDKCQLIYALGLKVKALERVSTSERAVIEREMSLLRHAIENDPEVPMDDVRMPDAKSVPRRKIARHMRITEFPRVLAIHLSRSIFDQSASTKNAAKVQFPERLPLGSILDRRMYRLLGIVCHKGSHHSGHYESFRRSHVYAPFSTPDVFRSYAQSRVTSENPSTMPSPRIHSLHQRPSDAELSRLTISTDSEPSSASSMSIDSLSVHSPSGAQKSSPTMTTLPSDSVPSPSTTPTSNHDNKPTSKASPTPVVSTKLDTDSKPAAPKPRSSGESSSRFRRKKQKNERWWRISDEKVKECKTSDVLGMQREVYLLFYELERPGDDA